MEVASIIVTAGGIGKRMQGAVPKQFLRIQGEIILFRTLRQFYTFNPNFQLIVTLPNDWIEYCEKLIKEEQINFPFQLVAGGSERFHSIQNALVHCQHEIIAVHDAVRPFVGQETLRDLFSEIKKHPAVIPVIVPKDSIRQVQVGGSISVPRSEYRLVQTPQVFRASLLRKAYDTPYRNEFTDDASVVEFYGEKIVLVNGNSENIKITEPQDLLFGELLAAKD